MLVPWEPVRGCSAISLGCQNCKALAVDGGPVRLDASELAVPLNHSTASEFLVCPHSDLFHCDVPEWWIVRVLDIIAECPQHIFQLLTKRAGRMREIIKKRFADGVPRNLWLGVSAESQADADERVPQLQATKAGNQYLTLFPLLSRIELHEFFRVGRFSLVLAGDEDERPAKKEWFDLIAEDCRLAGIPYANSSRIV